MNDGTAVESHKLVADWLQQVVVGMNFCPFARLPLEQNRIRFYVSEAQSDEALFPELQSELTLLSDSSPDELETTIFIVNNYLKGFDDYLLALDMANALLEQEAWEGEFQIASFHPQYQFAGTQEDDRENYTNRAPKPIFHLLREQSISDALASYPEPDKIPERNIQSLQKLDDNEFARLFAYLLS